jgi:hypothetical protein
MAFPSSFRKFLESMTEPTTPNPHVQNKGKLNPEPNWFSKWKTSQFGGKKMSEYYNLFGQDPMKGPDILKYIKKHDPQNTAGANKNALDIMMKLEKATETDSLESSIIPMQNILGNDLYGKMKNTGSQSKTSKKTEESEDIISELIAAAIDCTANKNVDDAELAAEKLNGVEIAKIQEVFYLGGTYKNPSMPQTFVQCINQLMPTYRAKEAVNG